MRSVACVAKITARFNGKLGVEELTPVQDVRSDVSLSGMCIRPANEGGSIASFPCSHQQQHQHQPQFEAIVLSTHHHDSGPNRQFEPELSSDDNNACRIDANTILQSGLTQPSRS